MNGVAFFIEIQKILILSVWPSMLKHTNLLHYSINKILMDTECMNYQIAFHNNAFKRFFSLKEFHKIQNKKV